MRTARVSASSRLVAALVALAGARAHAQQAAPIWASYQNYPLGGRTATMGGAAMAFGQDSAMALLNPAGLAQVTDATVSLSASAYGLHAVHVERFQSADTAPEIAEDPNLIGPVDTFRSQVFDAFPTSFVYSWPWGRPAGEPRHYVLSLSALVPRRDLVQYVGDYSLSYAGIRFWDTWAIDVDVAAYHVGPSFAAQITRRIRAGVAPLGVFQPYRSTWTISQREITGVPTYMRNTARLDTGTSFDLVPVVGVQVVLTRHLSAGASVAARSLHLSGSRTLETRIDEVINNQDFGYYAVTTAASTLEADGFEIRSPWHVAVGVGYERPGRWAVALDGHFYGPVEYDTSTGTMVTSTAAGGGIVVEREAFREHVRGEPVIDANIGGEYFLTPKVALRAGFFTDFSAVPGIEESREPTQMFARRIDQMGGTAGVGFYTGPLDFTVGAIYVGGRGEFGGAPGPAAEDPDAYPVVDATESRLMIVVTGGVTAGQEAAIKAEDKPAP